MFLKIKYKNFIVIVVKTIHRTQFQFPFPLKKKKAKVKASKKKPEYQVHYSERPQKAHI